AALAVGFDGEARLLGDVGERAVVIVVIQRGERFLLRGGLAGPVHRIDDENVGPAVIVVVDDAHTAAHRFGQILFAKGTGVVFEVDASGGSDVGEFDWA